MADKEKVIKGLECCNQTQEDLCGQCPYFNDFNGCMLELRQDALALLKAQDSLLGINQKERRGRSWGRRN